MKNIVKSALVAGALAVSTPAFATDIIVVSHGQANDAFWSVVKNGVSLAAEH
ncbi:MAG: LacI family transcriptional regulator, partial [Pseudomonadota bacterium]